MDLALINLEVYCRSNSTVSTEIKNILDNPTSGIEFFFNENS